MLADDRYAIDLDLQEVAALNKLVWQRNQKKYRERPETTAGRERAMLTSSLMGLRRWLESSLTRSLSRD